MDRDTLTVVESTAPPISLIMAPPPVRQKRQFHPWWIGRPLEERIKSLEDEVESLHREIVSLAPDDLRWPLQGHSSCKSREALWAWERAAVEAVIDFAAPKSVPDAPSWRRENRANCPLCHSGTTADWGATDVGWSIPEGLERHLLGHGRSTQCIIMRSALHLAREYARPYCDEAEADEDYAMGVRRQTETVYMVDRGRLQLADERLPYYWAEPRGVENMPFVEDRLTALGFTRYQEKNVVSYQLRHGEYAILADPRKVGRIEFNVCRIKPRKNDHSRSFYLLDSWKKDLKGKFETRLADCLRN